MYIKRAGEMSPEEAQAEYNISAAALRKGIAEGSWPVGYMAGRNAIILREKLEAWLAFVSPDITVYLTEDQIDQIAPKIAELVADRLMERVFQSIISKATVTALTK